MGAYYELKKTRTADERRRVKTTLANQVNAGTGIDIAQCNDALDLLEAVLFNSAQQTYQPPSSSQYVPQTQTYTPYNVQTGNSQFSKKGSVAKNFFIFLLVIALIVGIGYYVITNPDTNFNMAFWQGYSSYAAFSKAADMDEFLGSPLDESGFMSLMSLVFLAQFLVQDEDKISVDIVSGSKLTERYGVSESLRRNYNYLTKISPIKSAKSYIAYFNGDNWVVLIYKNEK
jgi:hypothetical protein